MSKLNITDDKVVDHVTAAVVSGTFEILLHQMASKSEELLSERLVHTPISHDIKTADGWCDVIDHGCSTMF